MRRRLDLAASLVGRPSVIFLDEPTTGLDPSKREDMWGVVRSLVGDGSTVLLTTQYLDEADALADEITVIDHGRVIAHDTPDGLKRIVGGQTLMVRPLDPTRLNDTAAIVAELADARPDLSRGAVSVPVSGDDVLGDAVYRLGEAGIAVTELSLHLPSLDEVFFNLTGRREPGAGGAGMRTIKHSAVLAKRNLIGVMRNPEALLDVTLQPVIFIAMFTYIFGGAIANGSQHDYLQYLLPGVLAQTIAFGAVAIGVNLNTDISKGVFDRFRSLPISRSAPLVGAVLADIVRYALLTVVTLGFGYILGFRATTSPFEVLAAVVIAIAFALCLSWASVFIGMIARTPGAVQGIVFLIMFPLTFGTSTFVPIDTMPGWLQSFTDVNPLTHLIGTLRGLMLGGPVQTHLLWTLLSMVGCWPSSSRSPYARTGAVRESSASAASRSSGAAGSTPRRTISGLVRSSAPRTAIAARQQLGRLRPVAAPHGDRRRRDRHGGHHRHVLGGQRERVRLGQRTARRPRSRRAPPPASPPALPRARARDPAAAGPSRAARAARARRRARPARPRGHRRATRPAPAWPARTRCRRRRGRAARAPAAPARARRRGRRRRSRMSATRRSIIPAAFSGLKTSIASRASFERPLRRLQLAHEQQPAGLEEARHRQPPAVAERLEAARAAASSAAIVVQRTSVLRAARGQHADRRPHPRVGMLERDRLRLVGALLVTREQPQHDLAHGHERALAVVDLLRTRRAAR